MYGSAVARSGIRSWSRRLLAGCLALICSMAQHAVPDNGLSPAPSLSAADLARLEKKAPATQAEQNALLMSAMGAIAAGYAPAPEVPELKALLEGRALAKKAPPPGRLGIGSVDRIAHDQPAVAGQAEASVAINTAGTVLVAGFNDGRGFGLATATGRSLSGVSRSLDGGLTWSTPWTFNGLPVLPAPPNGSVFGDPEVKYDPTRSAFVYASIFVRPSDGLQGMSIHTSVDNGTTWVGPFEVTPTFVAGGAADKEFMDINPVTGRIVMSWSHFSTSPTQIRVTWSDDFGLTWSPAVTLDSGSVQSSIPRIVPGTSNADSAIYVAWRRVGAGRNVGFSRSLDGGLTWSPAVSITTDFAPEDQILGLDRVNTSPAMAVDHTNGNVYVVYQANNSRGEGDVAFQVSADNGATWSPRKLINSDPGNDRAQWYPTITVDQTTRRVHVVWYDQHASTTGDVTELMRSWSDDFGATWSPPVPAFDRPFHAGFGNDTSQPNLGDYNQNVAVNGVHHVVAAATAVAPRFDEGQPSSASMITPDVYHDQVSETVNVAALRLSSFALTEDCTAGSNGSLDPGESANLTVGLRSYVLNPVSTPATYTGVSATLSTTTAGVTVSNATQGYSDIAPGAAQGNATPFRITLAPSFVPGASIDLVLTVTTAQGSTELPYRLATGTPNATPAVLLNQSFDGVPSGSLPAGWSSAHGGGTITVPWTTSTTLTPTNAAFHVNDGTGTRWERLISPIVTVPTPPPGTESSVTLDFDIAYNTEDEPTQDVLAYDGVTLRLTDNTTGSLVRSVLVEAFAEVLTTGAANHFPKHLPRSSNTAYFQDMSVWAGNSGGMRHVTMKFPGAGMTGRAIQLRFEYTEDSIAACATPPCGVAIDNIVIRHVTSTANQACTTADLRAAASAPATVTPGQTVTYTTTVSNVGGREAANVTVASATPPGLTFVSNSGACATAFPCDLGTLASTASATITSVFSIPASYTAPNPVVSTFTATTSSASINPGDDAASASSAVSASADLAVARTGPASATPGAQVTYTITVTNNGPSDAAGVQVADSVPSGLTFVSNSGDCATAFPCSLGTVAAGASRTITATYALASSYATDPLAATSAVSATTADPVASNNSATASAPLSISSDLRVTKAGPAAISPGGNAVYTIEVINDGPSDATGVQATDAAPAGFTFVSNTGDCTTAFPCDLGSIAAGARKTFVATFSVAGSYRTPDPAVNTASATSASPDPDTSNNSGSASSAVNLQADVAVAISGPASIAPGGTADYTLTVTNNGPSSADGATLDHTVPAGFTFVSNSGDCTGPFPCDLGSIPSGATRAVTARYSVPGSYSAPNPAPSSATVATTTLDPTPGNNTASTSSPVVPQADLRVALSAAASVVAGGSLAYTITVTNDGPSGATGVMVALPTPSGLTFVSSTGACSTALPCSVGDLAAGGTASVVATFAVAPGYSGPNPIVAGASAASSVADPDSSNSTATASTSVTHAADLAIAITAPATVIPGDTVSYNVTVTNNGPSDASGVMVADAAPSGLTFASNTGACTTAFPCDLGTLAPGQAAAFVATYSIGSALTATPLTSGVQVSTSTADPDTSNDAANASSTVTPRADLEVAISAPATVNAGASLAYTITVTNHGPSDATAVSLAAAPAAGLTFTANAGACTGTFPCALPSLGAGQTATVTSTWALPSSAAIGAALVTTATVSSSTADPTSGNDGAQASTDVTGSANLSIAITGPASMTRGTSAAFTITVSNAGPSDAAGVSVSSALPSGATFISNAGDCSTEFPCALGSLASGASRTFTSTVGVFPGFAGGSMDQSVTASATTADPDGTDNTASGSTPVTSSADLLVSIVGPAAAERGKPVEYTITVRNIGPSNAEGVVLDDAVPAGLAYTSNRGDCATAWPCALGTVAPGGIQTVMATFTVNKDAPDGPITNAATVTANTPDPIASNNTASVTLDSGPTGCGCGQAPGASPAFLLAVGLAALARRRRKAAQA